MKTLKEVFYELLVEGLNMHPCLIERGDINDSDKDAPLQEFIIFNTLISAIKYYGNNAENFKVVYKKDCSIEINGRFTSKIGIKIKLHR